MTQDTTRTTKPTRKVWGSFPSSSTLPNTADGPDGPELRAGDLASVGSLLYRCTDATPNAATWEKVPTAADVAAAMNPHSVGEIYITASALTTPAGAGTPLKVLGTTALGPSLTAYEFDMPANNRLRYTGAADRVAHIAASFSVTCASNNQTISFYVAKNGAVLPSSRIRRRIGTGADVGSTALHVACDLVTNDYLELWVANDTSTAGVTMTYANFFAMAMDKGA